MAEKEFTFQEARQELAKALKDQIAAHTSKIEELRKRELKKSAGGVAVEPCLLCANLPSACTCLRKNATLGYGDQVPGLAQNEMCKAHGGKHPMGKCDMSDVKPGKDVAKNDEAKSFLKDHLVHAHVGDKKDPKKGVMPKGAYKPEQSGSRPGGGGACSECGKVGHSPSEHKTNKTNKDELPAFHAAPSKAVAGAKLPKPGKDQGSDKEASGGKVTKVKKSEGFLTKLVKTELRKDLGAKYTKPGTLPLPGMTPTKPKGVVGVPGKQPVGMGGGDAHKLTPAATSVNQANKELGGFKSLATNPTAPMPTKPGVLPGAAPAAAGPGAGPAAAKTKSPILRRLSGMSTSQAALQRDEMKAGIKKPVKKGLALVNHNRRLLA